MVAVSGYSKESGFDPISFPVRSADRLLGYFRGRVSDPKPFKDILLWPALIDSAATTDRIRSTLHDVATRTHSDDVVVIYLAGHGQTSFRDEMFYFASADSVAERLTSTGLSTAALADALREMNARRVVLLVDSCQAGGTIEALQSVAQSRATLAMARASVDDRNDQGLGIYLVAATLPVSYALGLNDGSKESAFATALFGALETSGSPQGIREVIDAVRMTLPSISNRLYDNFRQTPLIAAIGLDFPITAPGR